MTASPDSAARPPDGWPTDSGPAPVPVSAPSPGAELDALHAHLLTRHADWRRVGPGREWTPAQEAEHVLLIGQAGVRAVRLLLSERALRPLPHTPGTLREGRRQAPAFAWPSAAGLAWGEIAAPGGRWAEHRAALHDLEARAALAPAPDRRTLWHPFLGELDARGWLDSLAAHAAHHRRLLDTGGRP